MSCGEAKIQARSNDPGESSWQTRLDEDVRVGQQLPISSTLKVESETYEISVTSSPLAALGPMVTQRDHRGVGLNLMLQFALGLNYPTARRTRNPGLNFLDMRKTFKATKLNST